MNLDKIVLYIILFITGYITYKLFTNKNTFSLSAAEENEIAKEAGKVVNAGDDCNPKATPPQMCRPADGSGNLFKCPDCGKENCPCKPPPPPAPPTPPSPPEGTPDAKIIDQECTCYGGIAKNDGQCTNISPTNCSKCNDGYKLINYQYYAYLDKNWELKSASMCEKIIPYCTKEVVAQTRCSPSAKYVLNTNEMIDYIPNDTTDDNCIVPNPWGCLDADQLGGYTPKNAPSICELPRGDEGDWVKCECDNGVPKTNKLYPSLGPTTCPFWNPISCDKCNEGYVRTKNADGKDTCIGNDLPLSCSGMEAGYVKYDINTKQWTEDSKKLSTVTNKDVRPWWHSYPLNDKGTVTLNKCGQFRDGNGVLSNAACGLGWDGPRNQGVPYNKYAYCPIGKCYLEQDTKWNRDNTVFSQLCMQPLPYNTEYPSVPEIYFHKLNHMGTGIGFPASDIELDQMEKEMKYCISSQDQPEAPSN